MGMIEAAVEICERNPVKSKTHNFTPLERDDYDALRAKGRTLYDNLRTQFDFSHDDAHVEAYRKYGHRAV